MTATAANVVTGRGGLTFYGSYVQVSYFLTGENRGFDKRFAGESNASVQQGVAFLRHVYALVAQVPGSARFWKYAVVRRPPFHHVE